MKKLPVDLRSFMRGKSYDDQDYLTQREVFDDMCPLDDRWDMGTYTQNSSTNNCFDIISN